MLRVGRGLPFLTPWDAIVSRIGCSTDWSQRRGTERHAAGGLRLASRHLQNYRQRRFRLAPLRRRNISWFADVDDRDIRSFSRTPAAARAALGGLDSSEVRPQSQARQPRVEFCTALVRRRVILVPRSAELSVVTTSIAIMHRTHAMLMCNGLAHRLRRGRVLDLFRLALSERETICVSGLQTID